MMSKMMLSCLLVATAASVTMTGVQASGNHPWEWAGVFDLEKEHSYTWTFAVPKEKTAYPDDTMKFLFMNTTVNDANLKLDLEHREEVAEALFGAASANIIQNATSGAQLVEGTVYNLYMDKKAYMTYFNIQNLAADGHYVFYCQHFPIEFERDSHYLKNEKAVDIEPLIQEPAAASTDTHGDVGLTVGITVVVALMSFVGVAFLVPGIKKVIDINEVSHEYWQAVTGTFAAGALMACTFMIMFPEAVHMVGSADPYKSNELLGNTAIGAVSVAAVLCSLLLEYGTRAIAGTAKTTDVESDNEDENAKAVTLNVLLGDFFHNFADGLLLGAASHGCSATLWTIAAGTIAHEIAQEVADFFVLVHQGKLSYTKALLFNFLSSISVVIGGIISASASVSNPVVGFVLAMGGGVYLWIGFRSLMQKNVLAPKNNSEIFWFSFAFVLGVVLIVVALVASGHKHCEAGGGGHGHGDAHAGHNH